MIKYLSQMNDYAIKQFMERVVMTPDDEEVTYEIDRSDDPYIVYRTATTMLDGEDEPCRLTDTYELDDYDIRPFDYASTERLTHRWRTTMMSLWNKKYAEDYLLLY